MPKSKRAKLGKLTLFFFIHTIIIHLYHYIYHHHHHYTNDISLIKPFFIIINSDFIQD